MRIKNIIFDVGNDMVRWSPAHIIEKTFPEHKSHQHELRALKETDILECITLFQNTIHAVNAKDYSSIQKEQQVEIYGVKLTNFVMRKLL